MEKLYLILIEIGIFITLALAYYTIQKRRILRRDLSENLNHLFDLLSHYELDMELIGQLMEEKKLQELFEQIEKIEIKAEDQETLSNLKENLRYHIKHS